MFKELELSLALTLGGRWSVVEEYDRDGYINMSVRSNTATYTMPDINGEESFSFLTRMYQSLGVPNDQIKYYLSHDEIMHVRGSDLIDNGWWTNKIKSIWDYEQNPTNESVWMHLDRVPAQYAGKTIFITFSGNIWVYLGIWIIIEKHVLEAYVIPSNLEIANEYLFVKELIDNI
ncbi:hypothetical protein D3C78_19970 [compost metagenome]